MDGSSMTSERILVACRDSLVCAASSISGYVVVYGGVSEPSNGTGVKVGSHVTSDMSRSSRLAGSGSNGTSAVSAVEVGRWSSMLTTLGLPGIPGPNQDFSAAYFPVPALGMCFH